MRRISVLVFFLCLPHLWGFQDTREVSADGLIYDLQHPEAERRREAARLLGANGIRQAVPALIDATGDPDDSVRLEVVKALVDIRDTRALKALIQRVSDPRDAIQVKAIEGIVDLYVIEEGGFVKEVGKAIDFFNPLSDDFNSLVVEPYVPVSDDAVGALRSQLADDDADVRRKSAVALGIFRANAALPDITRALGTEGNRSVKVELIRSVYKIGDPSFGSHLLPMIEDDSKRVRDEAIFALGRLRIKEAVPRLTNLLGVEERRKVFKFVPVSGKDDLQRRALQALAEIGDPRSRDVFVNALQDPRDDYRQFGAEGLARLGDDSLLIDVAKLQLVEKTESVRLAMAFALYRLGREEHLIQLVDSLSGRDQAYFYMLEFDSQEVTKLYPYLEKPQSVRVKRRLIEVLGNRGDQTAIAMAERYSRDPDSQVAAAAVQALRRLRART